MRKLTVIRIEGIYVLCEDEEKKLFAIEQAEPRQILRRGTF